MRQVAKHSIGLMGRASPTRDDVFIVRGRFPRTFAKEHLLPTLGKSFPQVIRPGFDTASDVA